MKTILAMVGVAALAAALWVLAVAPKRQEADKLQNKIATLNASIAQSRQEAAAGIAARGDFSQDYEQLVLLGKAVPGDDDTPSLLVQLNGIAKRAGVKFADLTLGGSDGGSGSAPAPTTPTSTDGTPVSPTEAAASLLPLGASIGSAGLGVMPYTLTFSGSFFGIADFIKGLDALTKVKGSNVVADGRLITLNDFTLTSGDSGSGGGSGSSSSLQATLIVTTYLTPPDQGLTAGATPTAPSPSTAVPTSTTTTGAP